MESKNKVADIKDQHCIPCVDAGTKRAPIPTPKQKVRQPLESTHTDISDKLSIPSLNGCHYFIVFSDDGTTRNAVYFLREKSELPEAFSSYNALVENKLNVKMNRILLDKVGEHIG